MNREAITFFMFGFGCAAILVGAAPIVFNAQSFIFQYQTLLTGIFAFAVGVPSISYLRRQVEVADQQRRDSSERNRKIALAALAIYINEVNRYARSCIETAHQLQQLIEGDAEPSTHPGPDVPILDSRVVTEMANAAGSVSEAMATQIASILNKYQVLTARIEGFVDQYRRPHIGNMSQRATTRGAERLKQYAAQLDLMAEALYEPVREGADFGESLDPENVEKRINFILGFPDRNRRQQRP